MVHAPSVAGKCVQANAAKSIYIDSTTMVCSRQTPDLLLYLPGVDGLNIEAVQQCDSLSSTFDTWCMTVHGRDKSTFEELTLEVRKGLSYAVEPRSTRGKLWRLSFPRSLHYKQGEHEAA